MNGVAKKRVCPVWVSAVFKLSGPLKLRCHQVGNYIAILYGTYAHPLHANRKTTITKTSKFILHKGNEMNTHRTVEHLAALTHGRPLPTKRA